MDIKNRYFDTYGDIDIFQFNKTSKNDTEYYTEVMNNFNQMDLATQEGAESATTMFYFMILDFAKNMFTA